MLNLCIQWERLEQINSLPSRIVRRLTALFGNGGEAPCLMKYISFQTFLYAKKGLSDQMTVLQHLHRRVSPCIMKHERVNRERRTLREIAASGVLIKKAVSNFKTPLGPG